MFWGRGVEGIIDRIDFISLYVDGKDLLESGDWLVFMEDIWVKVFIYVLIIV